ncbi:SDR family oxidoreductase [Streptomyces gardneri]|uniref:SDR family oxidoreductase n=1 Tax=Streptomyces gardneri TaxID=66892 RepID=UPI003676BB19
MWPHHQRLQRQRPNRAPPDWPPTAPAKAGLIGLTRSLARELGPHGTCVNDVVPRAIQVAAENSLPAHHRVVPRGLVGPSGERTGSGL